MRTKISISLALDIFWNFPATPSKKDDVRVSPCEYTAGKFTGSKWTGCDGHEPGISHDEKCVKLERRDGTDTFLLL